MINASGRPIVLVIDDPSMIGEARRTATAMAGRLGFDETERGKVAIVATEAATNLSKHAKGGEILIQGLESGSIGGVDILSLDRGPGMSDVHRCMADGFSTAGSPGTGLGAMSRLASVFDIYSHSESGTATLARLWSSPSSGRSQAVGLELGTVNIPVAGEEVCGDAWAIEEVDGQILVLVVDGLGHGLQAAEAARGAIEVFGERASIAPADVVQAAHASLRSTRGAALAVARIDPERGEVRFAGIGNISGSIHGPADARSLSMVSHNGIVGHSIRKIQEFSYPWVPGSLLVMHSDGLSTQWQFSRYAALASKHPGLVAGTLYRDFKRIRDDVTVLVVREGGADSQ
jgi:anti-sigma regulatory factor (Ser/Thr protein kinase)